MAADKEMEKVKTLSPDDIKKVVKLPSTASKEFLAEKLGIPPYLDTEDLQKAPFITYMFDNVMFASEKGFPWEHISLVAKFAHQFLKGILVEHHQLPDALRDLKMKSSVLDPLSDSHKKQYIDFVYDTVLTHYHLYKFVFSRLRDTIKPEVAKEVIVPVAPLPLSEGQEVDVWEYQQQIKQLEKRDEDVKKILKETQNENTSEAPGHKTLEDLQNVPVPYSKMSLEELVNDILKGYSEKKEKELKITAEGLTQDLAFKLEKTAVARPAVLGSPPRFKPKSPSSGKRAINSNNNSLKSDKVLSARSDRSKSGRASATSTKSKR